MKKLLGLSTLLILVLPLVVYLFACCRGGDGGTTLTSGGTTTAVNSGTHGAQSTQTGTRGAADQRAVINLKDIASQETLSPPAPKAPKAIHRPLPGPNRRL